MSDNSYFHGSDSYVGHCPNCGDETGTTYNELCESCLENEPVKCHLCKDMVIPSDMTEHGCCVICLDYKAEEFTNRILKLIK